jgi:hypothetical protein
MHTHGLQAAIPVFCMVVDNAYIISRLTCRNVMACLATSRKGEADDPVSHDMVAAFPFLVLEPANFGDVLVWVSGL